MLMRDLVFRHLVTLFLILLFSIMLLKQKSSRDTDQRYFWMTVLSCLLLVLEDILEVFTSQEPSLRFWRTAMSVLGYTLRSTAALGLLLVVVPPAKRRFILYVPALTTLLVCSTAFFTDIAFGFDERYKFYRGPLGYVAFVVPGLYMIMIVWAAFGYFSESKGIRKLIIPGSVLFCLCAAAADTMIGGVRTDEAIMISCLLFYIMLHAHDNRRDPLTGLLNRKAFYDDCTTYDRSITAAASLDMNGLKKMNDTLGHHAGDEALVRIADCLKQFRNRDILVYRIGGDEMVILFFHGQEGNAERVTNQVREDIGKAGCSISAGYAIREKNESLEEVIRKSDSRMYEDKANYYRTNGRDRRNRQQE